MRPTPPWSWLFPLTLLAAAGCAHPRFAYDVDPAYQSGHYATVAPDPRGDRILIREGMRPLNPDLHLQAVQAELVARKYRLVPAPEADLWVAVYVLTGGRLEGAGNHPGKAPHRGGGRGGPEAGGDAAAEREGSARGTFTIIVQLQDRGSGRPVWRGEANLDHREKGPDGRPLSIEQAVQQLLRPLPAQP